MLIIIVKTSYSNDLTISLIIKKLIFAKIRPGKSSVPLLNFFYRFSEKSFSLFSVVSFPNRECTTSSDTSDTIVNGVCQRDDECTSNGGTPSGNCASGFGVCCFYK